MVASCHRRSGDYQLAFEIYRMIHADFPDNVECLRYLVHICDDLGKKDQVHEYVVKRSARRIHKRSARRINKRSARRIHVTAMVA